jgi:hypothetical protein
MLEKARESRSMRNMRKQDQEKAGKIKRKPRECQRSRDRRRNQEKAGEGRRTQANARES